MKAFLGKLVAYLPMIVAAAGALYGVFGTQFSAFLGAHPTTTLVLAALFAVSEALGNTQLIQSSSVGQAIVAFLVAMLKLAQKGNVAMKNLLLVIVMCAVLASSMACTVTEAAWLKTADQILTIIGPALVNILQFVAIAEGKPMSAALAAKVNGDAAATKKIVDDFASADAAAQPGVCSQVQASFGVLQADEQQVFELTQVMSTASQQKAALLVGLAGSVFAAFETVIPSCNPASLAKATRSRPPVNAPDFVASYNKIMASKDGNPPADKRSPKLKIHLHSAPLRYASLGLLK
jgi:hypothetical protein